MAEEVIDRVDQMIRKNNIKYKDQQSQLEYQKALHHYEINRKKQAAKMYAHIIKEGNRKAVEKVKLDLQLKKQSKKVRQTKPKQSLPESNQIEKTKNKLSEHEKQTIDKTIEARAERYLQEIHLQRLSHQLEEEKKRNKLFELQNRCQKIVSKSNDQIKVNKLMPEGKLKILKEFEQKAKEQIEQIDNIIKGICEPNKGREDIELKKEREREAGERQKEELEERDELGMSNILFTKSTDELLRMKYIPI